MVSQIGKLQEKFFKTPIPTDITIADIRRLFTHYGCIFCEKGGSHPYKVIHKESGTVIPIPVHGKHIQDVYVKQLKQLLELILEDI